MCPSKFTFTMNARCVVINGSIYMERENNSNHLIPAELNTKRKLILNLSKHVYIFYVANCFLFLIILVHSRAQKCKISLNNIVQMRLLACDDSFVIYDYLALDARVYYKTPKNLEIIFRDRRVGSWDVRDVGKRIPFDEVSPVECVLFVDNSQTMFRKIREIRLSHFGTKTRHKEALAA
ncbi:hypothetical protein ALC57_16597 [Trachymyrmex cornetzi]|uniref:Uncharacterized protein n=1 Tax=Trachymyrmex cornetzi TaxID=471704 RepID=A0A151IUS2_9HYME|nr:hypothetical protein ALC57_16597 [Trachymyrmex cornetzi]